MYFDVEFTPGESFISTNGDVSIVAKLQNKDHWTTTYSCLEDTIHVIYNTLYLKRVAKVHIGPVSRNERRQLFNRFKESPRRGYLIFRELLLNRVLTITDGARASTVPKNNETDRFINVETTFGCMLQRNLASELLRVLSKRGNDIRPHGTKGYDKTDAQEIHKRMISNPDYATVDFSNASDSISCSVVSGMFPKHISSLLFKWRSHYINIRDDLYEPMKLSSMGNGFTFETMTLLLLSIARQLDPSARVFGDDVIIANEHADRFVRVCKIIGFNANMKKTFIHSKFRESCGAFYHDDSGYLLSYDIKRCENISDCVVVANKLFHLKSQTTIRKDVRLIFENMHKEITQLFPASMKGAPRSEHFALNAYVYSEGWLRAHRGNTLQMRNWKSMIGEVRLYNHNVDISNRIIGISWSPRYKEKYIRVTCRVAGAGANMYAMRRVKRHIRGAGSWTLVPLLVTNSGVVELKMFKSIVKQIFKIIVKQRF